MLNDLLWRDISTAPKDGSWILVFEPGEFEPNVWVVRWGIPEWNGVEEDWVTVPLGPNPDTYEASLATHWMPIPEAP